MTYGTETHEKFTLKKLANDANVVGELFESIARIGLAATNIWWNLEVHSVLIQTEETAKKDPQLSICYKLCLQEQPTQQRSHQRSTSPLLVALQTLDVRGHLSH